MQRNCDIARYECAALRAYDARAFPLLPREIWAEILSLVMHRPDTGLLLFLISKPFYLLMTVMWKNRFPEWDFQLIPRAPPILKVMQRNRLSGSDRRLLSEADARPEPQPVFCLYGHTGMLLSLGV